jgi:hypothetical protein
MSKEEFELHETDLALLVRASAIAMAEPDVCPLTTGEMEKLRKLVEKIERALD